MIVVLTGAGISAESGVPTFRDAGGLWEGHDVMEVATPEGFAADPDLVLRFYDLRRHGVAGVLPNPAHEALARLEAAVGDELFLVTQNVDDLHERAGSTRVLHMHGSLATARCTACEAREPIEVDLLDRPDCSACGDAALRPDVVWFGEYPYGLEEIFDAVERCDTFVAIGTSGTVQPAAGLVLEARTAGARTVEFNLAATDATMFFDEAHHGPASATVPAWVDAVIAQRA